MDPENLHCFSNGSTFVVAATLEEAKEKWDEWTCCSPDNFSDQEEIDEEHDIHQVPDVFKIRIIVEDELNCKPADVEIKEDIWTATAKAWADSQGKGFLCGEEY